MTGERAGRRLGGKVSVALLMVLVVLLSWALAGAAFFAAAEATSTVPVLFAVAVVVGPTS